MCCPGRAMPLGSPVHQTVPISLGAKDDEYSSASPSLDHPWPHKSSSLCPWRQPQKGRLSCGQPNAINLPFGDGSYHLWWFGDGLLLGLPHYEYIMYISPWKTAILSMPLWIRCWRICALLLFGDTASYLVWGWGRNPLPLTSFFWDFCSCIPLNIWFIDVYRAMNK